MEQEYRLELRWQTMAEALHGILDFGEAYGFWECQLTVLDQDDGVVATGSIGMGYT